MDEKAFDSEIKIIRQILDGETALFETLVRQNNAFLYKMGRLYNFNHEDTQDLMQETFIDAYTNLPKFENRSSFKTWIAKIMLNNCFRRKEKLSFKNERASEIYEDSIPMFSKEFPDEFTQKIMSKELNSIIETALLKIPLEYRLVLSLREINGLKVSETAEIMKISEANVKTRLNRAKYMLRKEIEKHYSYEDLFSFNLIYCDAMVSRVMNRILEIKTTL
jgi:RNA polymerase sigma factor (sigma-70 family)